MKANKRTLGLRLLLASLAALAVVSAGCSDSSMDNKYDESKLPPKPTNGNGPTVGGAPMAPGGGGAAPSGAGAGAGAAQPGAPL